MLSFVLGTIFGITIALIGMARLVSGTLKIDHSNPEKDQYRFEIDDLDKLDKRKTIILNIDHHADLSQD